MVRTIGLLLGILFVASLPAAAQDKVEVFGGYTYMRFRPSPDVNLNGWEASVQYKFRDWIGGVADFDGHYGSIGGVGMSVHSYMFGPQVSLPSRVSPFAHVLLGGAHFSAAGTGDSAFAMAIGAGMDTEIKQGISWRIIQGDYLLTRFGSSTQNNGRISDTEIKQGISWRIIQGDYLLTRFGSSTQNNGRISTGVVFRF